MDKYSTNDDRMGRGYRGYLQRIENMANSMRRELRATIDTHPFWSYRDLLRKLDLLEDICRKGRLSSQEQAEECSEIAEVLIDDVINDIRRISVLQHD